jgi:hypothetical protein
MFDHMDCVMRGLAKKEDTMERRLDLRGEVSSTEAVQILGRSDTNEGHDSDFRTHP